MAAVKYIVRNMFKEDILKALHIWRESGKQESKHTLYTLLDVDPEAFKIAVTDKGEVIGICAATNHHEDLAFGGFYCVKEKYRGAGIGFKLWKACFEHIGHRNACLYAVPEKTELYRGNGGFPIVEAKWMGFNKQITLPVNPNQLSEKNLDGVALETFEESLLPMIYKYDKKIIGYDRQLAIKLTFNEPESKTCLAVKKGECAGFGMIKAIGEGNFRIGPLYADDKEVAEVLLKKLIFSVPQENGKLSVMTPSNNSAANELFVKVGFETNPNKNPLLYRKKPLDIDTSKIYAIFNSNFSN